MNRLARFVALPAADRLVLVEAIAAVLGFRMAMWCLSVERLRRRAARQGKGSRPVDRIVWAIGLAGRQLPGTSCLCAALALQRLLSANGHESELHIGVASPGGAFAAHAWVERQGTILLGQDERDGYTPLIRWPVAGPSSR